MKDISVFVSSTFVDMQSERDLLRERILPELEEHVKKYGVNINFIDLRWGIDTSDVSEEVSTNKIVKTCVDEIIGSKPYFISLIGERYGWIPELKYIENALYALGLSDASGFENISITEFEIRVAEYLGKSDLRSLYFLREPLDYGTDEASRRKFVSDDADDRARIAALKKHIRDAFPDRAFDYTAEWSEKDGRVVGLDGFCTKTIDELKKLIDKDLAHTKKPDNRIEEFESFQKSYIASRNAVFRGRVKEMADICRRLDSRGKTYIITGESGNGKSALIAKLTEKLTERGGFVYPFFTGVHKNATDIHAALRCFIHAATGEYTEFGFDETVKAFYLAVKDLDKRSTHYFLIDAINQMDGDTDLESFAWLKPRLLPDNVKFIISTTPEFYLYKKLINACDCVIRLGGLAACDVAAVSDAYFKKNRKEAQKRIVDAISAKNARFKGGSPLFLKFMLNRAINLSGADFARIDDLKKTYAPADAIALHIEETINDTPLDLAGCYETLIDGMRAQFPDNFVDAAIALLAYTRYGMSERAFESVAKRLGIGFDSADFSYLVKLLREFLFSRNFVYDFNHGRVKQIVRGICDKKDFSFAVSRATLDLLEEGGVFDAEFTAKEYLNFAMLCSDYDGYAAYLSRNSDAPDVVGEFVAAFNDRRNLPSFGMLAAELTDFSFVLSLISKNRFGMERVIDLSTAMLNTVYARGDLTEEKNARNIYEIYTALGEYFYRSARYGEAYNIFALLGKFVRKTPSLKMFRVAVDIRLARAALENGSRIAMRSAAKRLSVAEAAGEEKFAAQAVCAEIAGRLSDYGRAPFTGKGAREKLRADTESMAEAVAVMPYQEAAPLFGVLCGNATKIKGALGGEKINKLAQKLEAEMTDDIVGAMLARELSEFYFATDARRSRELAMKAMDISDGIEFSAGDVRGMGERYKILVHAETFFHKNGERYAELLREQLALLENIANIHCVFEVYEAISRVQRELEKTCVKEHGRSSSRRKTFASMLSLSRGLKTQQSRQVNTVLEILIVLFLFGYLVIPMFALLVWGDYFAYIFDYTDAAKLVYTTLDNAFQTVYNIAFCAAYFGSLYVLQKRNSFSDKREWLIKLAVLILFLAALDFGYYRFSVFMSVIYRDAANYILKHYIMFKYTLAVGFTLVLSVLYESYLFYRDELKVKSVRGKYDHFVRGIGAYRIDAAVRLCGLTLNAALYAVFVTNANRLYGAKDVWTVACGVAPSFVGFAVVTAAIAAFIAARLVYTSIMKKRLESKYE